MFPGIRAADRRKRQALGLAALEKAYLNPNLVMEIEREVKLPVDDLIEKSAPLAAPGTFHHKPRGKL
jgi:hypothetical protein